MLIGLVVGALWLLQRASLLPFRKLFEAKPITVAESPLLVKNIRAIAQLLTIEYYDEVVVDSTRGPSIMSVPPYIFPMWQTLVLVVRGRLLAGLDLLRLDSSHISGSRDSVAIRLPRAQVLEVEMNPSDVETFAERGVWNQQAVAALTGKAKRQMLRNAASQGVLQRADAKAKDLVEQLMQNAGFKKVTITFQ